MIGPVDKIVCINLDRRPQRWQRFWTEVRHIPDWPFKDSRGRNRYPVRFAGIDGEQMEPPAWFSPACPQSRRGQWGCFLSHLDLIFGLDADDWGSILIFEDDAFFCPGFGRRYEAFASAVPDDWDMVYLGGNLLDWRANWPRVVNDRVIAPYSVLTTHAYLVRRASCPLLLEYLSNQAWLAQLDKAGIDRAYARIHATGRLNVYAPHRWLVGQDDFPSDVMPGALHGPRFWDVREVPSWRR